MNVDDFQRLVRNYTEDNILTDDPHVGMRCEENSITVDDVKRMILYESSKLIRLVEDRPQVYKLYYRLSRRQELKVVIDLFTHQKVNIRTVKRLTSTFKLGFIRERRF